jgi:hypothetical protein
MDPLVGAAILLGAVVLGGVILVRGVRRAQDGPQALQDERRAEAWRSLSPEQRQAAGAELRSGRAISDPAAAAVMLSNGIFDSRQSLLASITRVASIDLLLVATAMTVIGFGLDVVFLSVPGVVMLLALGAAEVMLRRSYARADRSRRATEALHGSAR